MKRLSTEDVVIDIALIVIVLGSGLGLVAELFHG